MPEFPFGEIIDPRDVAYEADAEHIRVEVWEGASPSQGGQCITYSAPMDRLADVLAWQHGNPSLQVNVGITMKFNGERILIRIAPRSKT